MDLRSVFSSVTGRLSHKEESNEHFLAVKISSRSVTATVWGIVEGKVEIGSVSSAQLDSPEWEDLLKSTDSAISKALESVKSDVVKVVFALPSSWTNEGKIVPDKLILLRRLCKELDLVPVGYVDLTEALQNYYKEIEGAPLTAILVCVDGTNSVISMYRAGKNFGSVPMSEEELDPDSLPAALEKALKKFDQGEILPSRILLYDGRSDLSEAAEKITAHPWTQRLSFLHFPKVETLPSEFMVKAVAIASGLQQGGKIAEDKNNLNAEKADRDILNAEAAKTIPEEEKEKEKMKLPGGPEKPLSDELEEVSAEEAGFITETNFNEIAFPVEGETSVSEETPSKKELKSETRPLPELKLNAFHLPLPFHLKIPQFISPVRGKIKNTITRFLNLFRRKKSLAAFEKSISPIRSSGKLPFPTPGGVFPIISGLLILILLLFFAVIYFVPRADLIITLNAKSFEHDLEVAVASSGPAAPQGPSVTGNSVDISEVSNQKGVATGQKLVGDKAHGTVTIYNSGDTKTFPAGTALASNSLKFVTTSDVTVASGSGIASQTTAQVAITAADIGDKYNLAANSLFTIDNLPTSSFQGKNDNPLTGGSSHQATVVTKDDQERLLATLSAQLRARAQADLAGKVPERMNLLPNAITENISKKRFSKDVDSEADTLTLDLIINYHAVAFSKDDMINLFKSQFQSDIPNGYSLSSLDISVKSARTDKKGQMYLSVHITGNLAPNIDIPALTEKIAGKSRAQAENTITKLPGVTAISVNISPRTFGFISKFALPWQKSHIKIELVTQSQ